MKKGITGLYFLILTFVLTFLIYKTLVLVNYRVEANVFGDIKYAFGDKIDIFNNTDEIDEKEIQYQNIVYQAPVGDLVLTGKKQTVESYNIYSNQTETNQLKAMFKVGKIDSLYNIFSSDDIFIYKFKLKNVNRPKLLKKYNLNDSYDIINYITNHHSDKVNIFSSINKIKMNYFMKTFTFAIIPSSKIYLIGGDYKGYIYVLDDDNYYEVTLLYNDENYVFSFINTKDESYFKMDDVKEFISNVKYVK